VEVRVDIFGNKKRQEIDDLKAKLEKASLRAGERQDAIHELQRKIEDLQGDVQVLKKNGAPAEQVNAAEKALRDAQAVHGRATR
jgi:uncharacterized coiled-coil DUF342 family protein